VLGVPGGTLAPGAPADLCLFDPQRPWVVTREALASQGRNSPFLGLELTGRVTTTIVDGRVVYPG
jgi:dihydroorotase